MIKLLNLLIFIFNRVKLVILVRGFLYKLIFFLSFLSFFVFAGQIKINGKSTYLMVNNYFISLKLINSISKPELKKELSLIKHLPEISEIKQLNKYSFVIKFNSRLTNENINELKNLYKILPSYTVGENSWPLVVSGRINLKFRKNTDIKKKNRIFSMFKLKTIKNYDFNRNIYTVQCLKDVIDVTAELYNTDLFEYVYPDFYILLKRKFIPNDIYYKNQWHHEDSYAGISSERAWDINKGNSNIKIAVLDDGVDLSHEDLNIFSYKDFTGKGFADMGEHGTACAGVIAAKGDNGRGVTGVCMNCSLVIAKVMPSSGYNLESMIVNAFEWSLNQGADIFNNSWGFDRNIDVNRYYPMLVDSIKNIIINGRNGKGGFVVFASGNESREFYNNSLEGLEGVITVGAIDYHGNRAYYSNYGEGLDFVAPSSTGFLGSDRDAVWTTDITGNRGYNDNGKAYQEAEGGREYLGPDIDNEGKYTKYFGGTSAAAPVVSGIIGLILSENDKLTNSQVYNILKLNSDKTGSGYDTNGHSNYLGYGKVNAGNSMEYLKHTIDLCENITCSGHGSCVEIENNKICNCDTGYESNNNLECVKIIKKTPCDDVTCSEHGVCKVVNKNPMCFCESGYVVKDGVHCVVNYSNSDSGGCNYGDKSIKLIFYLMIILILVLIKRYRYKK